MVAPLGIVKLTKRIPTTWLEVSKTNSRSELVRYMEPEGFLERHRCLLPLGCPG